MSTMHDNEVYILGSQLPNSNKPPKHPQQKWLWIVALCSIGLIIFGVYRINNPHIATITENTTTESLQSEDSYSNTIIDPSDTVQRIELYEESINDVPMQLFEPRNLATKLQVGLPDINDKSILYVAEAAFVRADNKRIMDDFVLEGKQLAYGKANTGYCSMINGQVYIGAKNDSIRLLEAINQKGYFFRQFLLVNNGYPVKEFFQKNKAVRRAIALRQGKLVIVESKNKESLHDFAQALADIDISQAVYLIGGTESYGWYRTKPENAAITFGTKVKQKPSSTSYIIFQRE